MLNISGSPIRRSENVSKKNNDGSSLNTNKDLDDGIFTVLALNEKQERDDKDGNNKDDQLGQFLRGIKDPTDNEIAVEDM